MLVILVMAHPTDPRVVVSTGYDGRVIFWDVIRGTLLREFVIEFMDLGNPLDCLDGAFSPDGMTRKCVSVLSLLLPLSPSLARLPLNLVPQCRSIPVAFAVAITDIWGQLTLFGYGSSAGYESTPKHQFFTTDSSAVIR